MSDDPPLVLSYERKSTFKPILITLLCSFLLAGGSCFAFFQRGTHIRQLQPAWSKFFAVVFVVAALTFVIACLWLLVQAIWAQFHK